MGFFKDAWNAQQERYDAAQQAKADRKAIFKALGSSTSVKTDAGTLQLDGAGMVSIGGSLTRRWGVEDVEVEVVSGGTTSHVSKGRVVAGTILAPGVGTIVGALAKKHKSHDWLIVYPPSGDPIEAKLDKDNLAKAKMFARRVDEAKEMFAAASH